MIDNKELSILAAALAAQVFEEAHTLLIGKGPETPENTEATVQLILITAAHLEAFVVNSLPPDKASNVRAFLDRFLREVETKKNLDRRASEGVPASVEARKSGQSPGNLATVGGQEPRILEAPEPGEAKKK